MERKGPSAVLISNREGSQATMDLWSRRYIMATSQLMFRIVGWIFLGLGGFICGLNFYLSFVRSPLLRKLGRKGEIRRISGFPFLGSVLVLYVMFYPLPIWAKTLGIVLVATDTGGPHWFLASVVWMARKKSTPERR